MFTQEKAKTSFIANLGLRLYVNRGGWAMVPGFGFSLGQMESATVSGFRATLAVRIGH